MSYFLVVANIIATACIIERLFVKLSRVVRQKSIKEVLFSNGSSACCTDRNFETASSCPSRYCLKKNLGRLIQLIDSSKHSVYLALYSLNCEDLQRAIKRAKKRNVRVKIVTTQNSMTELSRDMQKLSNEGIEIRFPVLERVKLLHHKFCLLDTDEKDTKQNTKLPPQGLLLTGSMNWTLSAICSNWDNIVVTSNTELIRSFQNEFDTMWARFRR